MASEDVSVFPNPASAQGWTVEAGSLPRGEVSVTLVTPSGAVVRKLSSNHAGGAFRVQVDARDLASGLYFLRVQGGATHWTGRVLLQR